MKRSFNDKEIDSERNVKLIKLEAQPAPLIGTSSANQSEEAVGVCNNTEPQNVSIGLEGNSQVAQNQTKLMPTIINSETIMAANTEPTTLRDSSHLVVVPSTQPIMHARINNFSSMNSFQTFTTKSFFKRDIIMTLIEQNPLAHIGVPADRMPLIKDVICPKVNITLIECYIILKKLRTNEEFELLAQYFEMSKIDVQRIFIENITKLARCMYSITPLSEPANFAQYVVNVESFGIYVETDILRTHWSKFGINYKYFMAANLSGTIIYVSDVLSGHVGETPTHNATFLERAVPRNRQFFSNFSADDDTIDDNNDDIGDEYNICTDDSALDVNNDSEISPVDFSGAINCTDVTHLNSDFHSDPRACAIYYIIDDDVDPVPDVNINTSAVGYTQAAHFDFVGGDHLSANVCDNTDTGNYMNDDFDILARGDPDASAAAYTNTTGVTTIINHFVGSDTDNSDDVIYTRAGGDAVAYVEPSAVNDIGAAFTNDLTQIINLENVHSATHSNIDMTAEIISNSDNNNVHYYFEIFDLDGDSNDVSTLADQLATQLSLTIENNELTSYTVPTLQVSDEIYGRCANDLVNALREFQILQHLAIHESETVLFSYLNEIVVICMTLFNLQK